MTEIYDEIANAMLAEAPANLHREILADQEIDRLMWSIPEHAPVFLRQIQDRIDASAAMAHLHDLIRQVNRSTAKSAKFFILGGTSYYTDGRIMVGDVELAGKDRERAIEYLLARIESA